MFQDRHLECTHSRGTKQRLKRMRQINIYRHRCLQIQDIISFIHKFEYFLKVLHVSSTVLGAGHRTVKKKPEVPQDILVREIDNK